MVKNTNYTILRPPIFIGNQTPSFINKDLSPLSWLLWHRIRLQEMNREAEDSLNIYNAPRKRRDDRHNRLAQSRGMALDEIVSTAGFWSRSSAHVPSARLITCGY